MGMTTILDGFYQRESYMYGGGWVSHENGVSLGTVRIIDGTLSQAWNIRRKGWPRKDEVLWKNVEPKELREVAFTERPA